MAERELGRQENAENTKKIMEENEKVKESKDRRKIRTRKEIKEEKDEIGKRK